MSRSVGLSNEDGVTQVADMPASFEVINDGFNGRSSRIEFNSESRIQAFQLLSH